MESQPQNPEFRINPEHFHPCGKLLNLLPTKNQYSRSNHLSRLDIASPGCKARRQVFLHRGPVDDMFNILEDFLGLFS